MKKILIYFVILIIGCSSSEKGLFKESYKALYNETDVLVQSLDTTYESYGIFGGKEQSVTINDVMYTIKPIGRLINVKIQKLVSDEEYEKLRKKFEQHYKNDDRVNEVYICKAGTVMIDCRN